MHYSRGNMRDLADEYVGGLAHVHTRLSNFPGHYESDQNVKPLVKELVEHGLAGHAGSPLKYLLVTDHTSNPVRPRLLGPRGMRLSLISRRNWRTEVRGVPVWYGLEASILPGGEIDLPWRIAETCPLVIASRHRVPAELDGSAIAMQALLERACANPMVDVLGHPARHIEGLKGMLWERLFRHAAETGTAIEVNVNTYPDPRHEPARIRFWHEWLVKLQHSGADVFLGFDMHNSWQREHFMADWRALGYHDIPNILGSCIGALDRAGIEPDRVVTSTLPRLRAWLDLDKRERAHVLRAKLSAPA